MREDWVAYLIVFTVVALMMFGKKMMFFEAKKEKDLKDKNDDKS